MIAELSISDLPLIQDLLEKEVKSSNKGQEWIDMIMLRLRSGLNNGLVAIVEKDVSKARGLLVLAPQNGLIPIIIIDKSDPTHVSIFTNLIKYVVGLDLESLVTPNGYTEQYHKILLNNFWFKPHERLEMQLDASQIPDVTNISRHDDISLRPWHENLINEVCKLMVEVTGNSIDGELFPQFKNITGCVDYLHSVFQGNFEKINKDSTRILVNKSSNQVIGYCIITKIEDDNYSIPIMGLAKSYRGKGLGKYLLLNSLQHLKLIVPEIKYVHLTVTKANHPAYPLYCKLGFKIESSETILHRYRGVKNVN